MNARVLLLVLILLPGMVTAQRWKRERHEFSAGFGASNHLGELGGADDIASPLFTDLEISLSRPSFSAAYRYRITGVFTFKGIFTYARINGDDRLTNEDFRNNRNLHFRSPLIELSPQIEWSFLKEEVNKRYRLKGIRGRLNLTLSGYLFAGIGGFYFNPRAKYNGEWHSLQPLGTEGQGLPGGPEKKYSRISMSIPLGIGFKYHINSKWGINLEYGYRFTFTDYLDDVSTVYYDVEAIRAANGDVAAALSNPALDDIQWPDGITVTEAGQQRGNPDKNDSYMIGSLMLTYKLSRSRSSRPKF